MKSFSCFTAFILMFLLFSATLLKGQVGEIKGKSNENKSNKSSGNKSDYPPKGDDGCTDGCFGCCFNAMFTELLTSTIEIQKKQLDKKSTVPRVISMDAILTGGMNQKSSIIAIPRVRGTLGIFSTDARYAVLLDHGSIYNTIDWQVLLFNVVSVKQFNLRIGTGFMYEPSSVAFFNEHSLAADLYLIDSKLNPSFEFRIVKDYNTGATPRTEGNVSVNYQFFQSKNFALFAGGGFLYQNYYSSIDTYSGILNIGFTVR